ncbi:hypothetical protein LJK88_23285 [Paenibacillus sp. P26]|nr:hypothetical protein LJK88_23285 [Paenibacillus sp. P26]
MQLGDELNEEGLDDGFVAGSPLAVFRQHGVKQIGKRTVFVVMVEPGLCQGLGVKQRPVQLGALRREVAVARQRFDAEDAVDDAERAHFIGEDGRYTWEVPTGSR